MPRPPLPGKLVSGGGGGGSCSVLGDRAPQKPPLSEEKLKIAFDITLMRPGCAMLQAAFGCPGVLADLFPVETWLLTPTENLRVYRIQRPQLEQLVQKARDAQQKRVEEEAVNA